MSKSRVRTAYFISTVSVALVLFLVGSIAYLIMNIEKAASTLMGDVTISALVAEKTSSDQLKKLTKEIAKIEGVSKVTYTSKEKAAKDFKEFIGSDFMLIVDENPLPASLEVAFNDKIEDGKLMQTITSKIKKMDGIAEVLSHENVIAQVLDNIYRFKVVMVVFGAALLLVSILLIRNTIRMAILSKRFIIKSMRLVGATNGFIRAPFIKNAFVQGLWAVLIASVALCGVIFALKQTLPEIELITNDWQSFAILFGGMLVTAVLICIFSTISAINSYIKLDDDGLYTY